MVLEDLHSGICGSHFEGRTLAHRANSQGYFWPYMNRDAKEFKKKCNECQSHAKMKNMPVENLHIIANPWPFAK